jgi:TPR repeat protein
MRRLQRPKHQKYPTAIDLNLIRPRFPNMIRKFLGGLLFIIVSLSLRLSAEKPQKLEEPPDFFPAPIAIDETAEAQFRLGLRYANGDGVPRDSAEALRWFRKAAEQGYAPAQYHLGLMYINGDAAAKNSAEAVTWLRKSADQGYAQAQCDLGVAYHLGRGIPQNSAEAVIWWRKSADQGYAQAQCNLGVAYDLGHGIPKDNAEAAKWYRKAADQGDALAQTHLGMMYYKGVGVPKDTLECLAWLNIAAAAGDDKTIALRDAAERELGPGATLSAQQRSKQILKEIEAKKRGSGSPTRQGSTAETPPPAEPPNSSGSGAVISTEGHILTAAHVVAGAKRVTVTTKDGTKDAVILRLDEANDLAVLRITVGPIAPLPIAPSRLMRLGQVVATIGFPNIQIQGFSPKVTRGEISSLNGIGDDPRAWQISVPVQTGNSGGPLLDENGNLVGVVVSKLGLKAAKLTGDLPQNVNYAVKSAYALALLEPYLGSDPPEANQSSAKPRFEDMVAKAQQSVVLILAY